MAAQTISYDHDVWVAVAEHVVRARSALGLTHRGLVDRAGPGLSIPVLSKIENAGQDSYKRRTMSALCRGLGWPGDAIDRIAAGRPPDEPLVERDDRALEVRLAELEAELATLRAELAARQRT